MTNVENDVLETFNFDDYSRNTYTKYSPVYPYTNEDLESLFSNLNVFGKNVLTVAGSGDQAFYAYHNGAKNVDLFDINCLTRYYYYLRMWVIKYFNCFYLDNFEIANKEEYADKYCNMFNITKGSFRYSLKNIDKNFELLLSIVEPSCEDEKNAYNYWKIVFKKCKSNWGENGFNYFLTNLFFADDISDDRKMIGDLSKVSNKILNNNHSFYNFDISRDLLKINKKYDVLIVSNIVDSIHSVGGMYTFRDNLYNLINDDGCCVLSNVKYNIMDLKKEFLKEVFEFQELPFYESFNKKTMPLGNVLVKK